MSQEGVNQITCIKLVEVEETVAEGAVVVVMAECEVEYTGRAEGYLGPGERLIVVKPDGTFLVHRPSGHDPVNWQPPGSNIQVTTSSEYPTITARRSNPKESVTARLLAVYSVRRFDADDTAPLELSGTETNMHEYLEQNPTAIEDGLRIIEHERNTKYGSIDFFARDSDGNAVLLEVKRRQATHKDIDQLRRYVDLYQRSNPEIRGVLVAPSASEEVKRELKERGLEFVSLDSTVDATTQVENTTFADFE